MSTARDVTAFRRPPEGVAVGPLGELVPDVRRIAVLRGGGLGDLMFALPAVRSLADAYPQAELVLLGERGHARLLADRPGPVRRVAVLPPGATAGDTGPGVTRFLDGLRRTPFDLAVQVHGGGRFSNPLLRELGARVAVGAAAPDAPPLDRTVPYRYYQHEVLRALEVANAAGAPSTALHPELVVTAADLGEADRALRGLPEPLLAVHPGAGDPRRRWPADRFAQLVARATDDGAGVAVVGTGGEAELVHEVVALARRRLPESRRWAVRALAGVLSAGGLAGVLARATVLLANDSGPRHLAEAVGTPTVSVYWMGNVINAGPLERSRHRVHIAWTARCPVCGVDCTREDLPRCEHDVSFVADVRSGPVWTDVADFLEAEPVQQVEVTTDAW